MLSAAVHLLPAGAQTVVNVKAINVCGDGTSTPITGTVTLEVEPSGSGRVDPGSIDLDVHGKGTAAFTMCSGCAAGSTARLTATLAQIAVAGQPLSRTTTFALQSGDAIDPCSSDNADCGISRCNGAKCNNGTGTCRAAKCMIQAGKASVAVLVDLFDSRGVRLDSPSAPVDGDPITLVVKVFDAQTWSAREGQIVEAVLQGAIGTLLPPDGATDGVASPLTTAIDGTARPLLRPPHQPATGSIEIRVTPATDEGPQPSDAVLLSKSFEIVAARRRRCRNRRACDRECRGTGHLRRPPG